MKRIIVFNIGTNLGGIETSLIQFLRFLAQEDCRVELVLWKKPGELYGEIPPKISIVPSPAPGGWGSVRMGKGIRAKAARFFRILRYKADIQRGCGWKHLPEMKDEYDIAISYCQNGYSPYYVIDKVKAKKRILFYHHGSYEADLTQYEQDQRYFRQYDQIITVSEANKNMLASHFPMLTEKIAVVHNLIDTTRIRRMAEAPTPELQQTGICEIVTVGRVSSEKGQMFALEVARELLEMDFPFRWLFVGDGPEKTHCMDRAAELGLSEICIFLGARENPYPYIKNADLYVQGSYVEADPMVLQEALVLSKPIVASDIPAIRETLHDGKLGILCGLSPRDFAERIRELYSSAPLQRSLRDNISQMDDRNAQSERLLRAYLGLSESHILGT